jgi:hypothetical protein
MIYMSKQKDAESLRKAGTPLEVEIAPAMVAAGLRALWDSGELSYEGASQASLVREVYRAMTAVGPTVRISQQNEGPF